jgi:hypothetical protein
MTPPELLSRVTDPNVIRDHFSWHEKMGLSLVLLMASRDGHVRVKLNGMDADGTGLIVVGTGTGDVSQGRSKAYSLVGTTPNGANFLASGTAQPQYGSSDCFRLSFPDCIEVSQSRDCYRSPAPAALSLHFSSTDPHLNDVVCRVKNVSLSGLAVEWEAGDNSSVPEAGTSLHGVILVAGDSQIQLRSLRIAHATRRRHHAVLGLMFEREVPRQYGALVLDAQRSHYFF